MSENNYYLCRRDIVSQLTVMLQHSKLFAREIEIQIFSISLHTHLYSAKL